MKIQKQISEIELEEFHRLNALMQEWQNAFDNGDVEEEFYFDVRLQNKMNEIFADDTSAFEINNSQP